MKLFKRLTMVALVAALATTASAQSDQAKISGTVRDQTGGFVTNASVSVKNERTSETRTTVSNDRGLFVVSGLKPAPYTIRVEKSGLAPIEYTNMELALGQTLALDFEFKPAGVVEEVSVVAEAPILELSSAKVGVNVSEREVESLPVNGRQMSQLMLQAPGSQNAGTGTWQDIRFSGRAVEQNAIRYDGVEGSAIIDAAPGNLNGEIPTPFKLQASLENVQEFRVESSSYPAEFGTGTGGQINVVTKSGGNTFTVRRSNTSATTVSTRRTTSTRRGTSTAASKRHCRSRCCARISSADRSAARSPRTARSSSAATRRTAWTPASTSSRPCRARRRGRGRCRPSRRSAPASRRRRGSPPRRVDQPGLRHRAAAGQGQHARRRRSAAVSTSSSATTGRRTFRFSHDQGKSDQPEGVTGRVVHITDNPTQRRLQPPGDPVRLDDQRVQVRLQRAPSTITGVAPSSAASTSTPSPST